MLCCLTPSFLHVFTNSMDLYYGPDSPTAWVQLANSTSPTSNLRRGLWRRATAHPCHSLVERSVIYFLEFYIKPMLRKLMMLPSLGDLTLTPSRVEFTRGVSSWEPLHNKSSTLSRRRSTFRNFRENAVSFPFRNSFCVRSSIFR